MIFNLLERKLKKKERKKVSCLKHYLQHHIRNDWIEKD